MSTELLYLFLTSLLLTVLWIPHVIGQVTQIGMLEAEEYVTLRDTSGAPHWVHRANRAHVNLVEQFGPFAGLVLVAHAVGVSTELTVISATVFFWARVVHAIVMIAGWSFIRIRTMIFTVSFAALLLLAWEIAAAKLL
ncbi:MAG: MAPEG family protein, partial [Proteobacteria bacterium]|nr:MAPEG family protein [Pseudomonadota bacterium]